MSEENALERMQRENEARQAQEMEQELETVTNATVGMLLKMVERFATDEAFTHNIAKFVKNLHDSYKEVGFSDEQAMQLCTASLASMKTSK